ncbi:uncharacterized protein STEHIDRAFT_139572 [Stereum hirsutum FP-91666 SS1]|uniref:uncharacterized protein n=1 Tax=Stereum hirsutum (strain FP-91666) TaxID=721885 RepID=UPI0004449754|nr:uncharacterized protein STEHIDRAFT_139572 [Stereum hirsutum FP-91666 SS1]EIM86843.1 hypothetical protein STEHIDRAFT_139572 [Stereum hirsutum FP-91666 SS1]
MDGRFMERQGSAIPRFRGRIRGVQTSAVSVRPFRFSDVPLASDNEDAIYGTVNYDTLGLIELQIHRVQLVGCDPDALVTRTATEVSPIPLRQIPPMDLHCVSLGAAIPSQLSHSLACLWDQLDPPDRPYVTFRFYYRPRQTLQTQGIIPFDDYLSTSSNRSFSPTPTRNVSTTKHRLDAPDDISIAGQRKRLKLEEPPSFSTATSSRMAADNAIQIPSLPSIGVRQESEQDSSDISIRIRTLEVALTLLLMSCPRQSEMPKLRSTSSERCNAYRGLTLMTEQALPQPARCHHLSQRCHIHPENPPSNPPVVSSPQWDVCLALYNVGVSANSPERDAILKSCKIHPVLYYFGRPSPTYPVTRSHTDIPDTDA